MLRILDSLQEQMGIVSRDGTHKNQREVLEGLPWWHSG